MDFAEPSSPKTPGTLVRAKKGAGPLRQEIQEKVDELQRRHAEVDACDRDLGVAMEGLDQSMKELESRIKREFTMMAQKLQEQMQARSAELVDEAKAHFEKLAKAMAEMRELLGEVSRRLAALTGRQEGLRVKACVESALEALGLDDAWFIQAYPDIKLEPGSSQVGKARDVLAAGNGSLALSFDDKTIPHVLCPAIRGHGSINSSLFDGPQRSSPAPTYKQKSPRSPKNDMLKTYYSASPPKRSSMSPPPRSESGGSILEQQVEGMVKQSVDSGYV